MKRYLRLYGAFLLQHCKTQLEYRTNFLLAAGGTALWNLASFLAVSLILDRVPGLAGWNRYELYLTYGLITLCFGVSRMFGFSLMLLGQAYIRPGRLDGLLVRPVNPLFHLLADRFNPEGTGDVAVALAVIHRALTGLGLAWTPAVAAYVALVAASGGLIFISLNLITAVPAFWIVISTPISLALGHVTQFARYPLDLYGKPLRIVLTWLLPYGLLTHYPALFLVGRGGGLMAFMMLPMALLLFLGAYRFWLYGLRHYSGTGS